MVYTVLEQNNLKLFEFAKENSYKITGDHYKYLKHAFRKTAKKPNNTEKFH